MGCLNAGQNFSHRFGNIHLSGPCTRACYFCIGQHMMALDALNTLDAWPLPGFAAFLDVCQTRGVREVNLTGSNTDPLLYQHHEALTQALRAGLGRDVVLGIRTNGIADAPARLCLDVYDKIAVSLTSLDPVIYARTMGHGAPPDLRAILDRAGAWGQRVKVNVVLCPELLAAGDLWHTLDALADLGVRAVNLREPYGQPHIGDPLAGRRASVGRRLGMPLYAWMGMDVTYWDVHYCEVESVNLYANGRVSFDYPITRGHAPTGEVHPQAHWQKSGRIRDQWVGEGSA